MGQASRSDDPGPYHRPVAVILAVALIASLLGLAGAATAGHYTGTQWSETAIRDYEAPSSFGLVAVATHNDDPIGVTSDGSIDTGGLVFPACKGPGTPGGLRCSGTDDVDGDGQKDPLPEGPYDRAEIRINDQVSWAVLFSPATCSADGDFYCGEEDNTRGGDGGPSTAGPDELEVTTCAPERGILERDPNDPRDGTGDGVWDQTGESYDGDGDAVAETEHPGVLGVSVFLLDPVAEALYTDDACNGLAQEPTTGKIMIWAA